MYIDLHSIEDEGVRFDERLRPGPLSPGGEGEPVLVEGRFRGEAQRGTQGVDFVGVLDARLRVSCARCLEELEIPVRLEVRLILVPDAAEFVPGEGEMDENASLFFYAEGGRAELQAIATEQFYLNLPLKPICAPDCRGLCPTCGANRNRLECGCRIEDVDPRLAPLLEFKKRNRKA
jgi:uncharacterized protein